jgi:hypothetical protein
MHIIYSDLDQRKDYDMKSKFGNNYNDYELFELILITHMKIALISYLNSKQMSY